MGAASRVEAGVAASVNAEPEALAAKVEVACSSSSFSLVSIVAGPDSSWVVVEDRAERSAAQASLSSSSR